jgi:SAM-dependent methyltransferase
MTPHTAKNARAYDERAHAWAARIADDAGHKYLEKPAMENELADDLEGDAVLCIGVGSGTELAELLRRRPACVVAIDISMELLRIASARYPSVRFLRMDMMSVALRDRTFDYVYSSLAFHYADDWERLLGGVHRVLRPGGTLLFSTHHPGYWAQKPRTGTTYTTGGGMILTEHVATLPTGGVEIIYYNHPDERSITESVHGAGFIVQACVAPDVVRLSAARYAGLDPRERARYDDIKTKNSPLPLFLVVRAVKTDSSSPR